MTTSHKHDETATEDTAAQETATGDTAAEHEGQPAVSESMLRALAQSIGLLPQGPPPDAEDVPEGAVMLPVIEQDGTQYVPVFTSEDALRAAGADPSTAIRLPIAELAAQWPGDDLWLAVNPASEQGLALPPDLVRALPIFAQATPNGDTAGSGE
jgi:hypothetical protein